MKTANKRNKQYILLLDETTAQKLEQLAERNDHAPSKQAYLIIREELKKYLLKDENGRDIIEI